eukprot:CAMPEP_0196805788 /NCGR_PEP_ID=MMETSP1362-20130617/5609_1 /TAXON_ID=163516 /ORGANISM="Leptocylindrus danicus, Strain CCMP1856" /LENGTH=317 /DNA_ID=CAMNT_0042178921 /DNA_START=10 /DNA_END=960 /DNA_ORIENTATION=+
MSNKRVRCNDDNDANRFATKRSRDRVILDVGGTEFVTSTITLKACSAYFRALFSDQWTLSAAEAAESTTIFIDQSPEAFRILLDYMREGCIECKDLTRKVILLTEFLGLETLITEIKATAFANMNPTFTGTKNEAIDLFDQAYGSFKGALSGGILPTFLSAYKDSVSKEFASITFIKKDGEEFPYMSFEAKKYPNGPRSFESSLTWIHGLGFTTLEDVDRKALMDGAELIELPFSKPIIQPPPSRCTDNAAVDEEDAPVIIGKETRPSIFYRKEFARLFCSRNPVVLFASIIEVKENVTSVRRHSRTFSHVDDAKNW